MRFDSNIAIRLRFPPLQLTLSIARPDDSPNIVLIMVDDMGCPTSVATEARSHAEHRPPCHRVGDGDRLLQPWQIHHDPCRPAYRPLPKEWRKRIELLYNLSSDPAETSDLAAGQPKRVAGLRGLGIRVGKESWCGRRTGIVSLVGPNKPYRWPSSSRALAFRAKTSFVLLLI